MKTGKKILTIRLLKMATIADLGSALNKSPIAGKMLAESIENGNIEPTKEQIIKIAQYFSVSKYSIMPTAEDEIINIFEEINWKEEDYWVRAKGKYDYTVCKSLANKILKQKLTKSDEGLVLQDNSMIEDLGMTRTQLLYKILNDLDEVRKHWKASRISDKAYLTYKVSFPHSDNYMEFFIARYPDKFRKTSNDKYQYILDVNSMAKWSEPFECTCYDRYLDHELDIIHKVVSRDMEKEEFMKLFG